MFLRLESELFAMPKMSSPIGQEKTCHAEPECNTKNIIFPFLTTGTRSEHVTKSNKMQKRSAHEKKRRMNLMRRFFCSLVHQLA
ncbi:hypothetical protein [Herbaspirillum huttiense]|uniref:hypothetical protein n=1 Tax=Herbaspirillum huttiense TaxID=863372 RepID=UPI0012FEDAF8|nr:hypothetical protein [Herbaspirillum huttiense]